MADEHGEDPAAAPVVNASEIEIEMTMEEKAANEWAEVERVQGGKYFFCVKSSLE